MTGAHSQTFKAAQVTVAPDRSRQVVSERNTFPQMTSLCRRARHRVSQDQRLNTQSKPTVRSRPDLYSPNKFCSMILSARTFCLLPEGSAASLTDQDPD